MTALRADHLEALVRLLQNARNVFVFTGAGMSTRSNIPDFRGPQGIYRERSPVYFQQFVASEQARREYWAFKAEGHAAFRDAQPNAAHHALVTLEKLGKLQLIATQNVDGLQQLAGTSSERLVELHGTNRSVECLDCGREEPPDRCMAEFEATAEPPRCLACGGWMKPAVVMFGQGLDMGRFQKARASSQSADLVCSLGSTLLVAPACELPLLAVRAGAKYVIINQGETSHDTLATLRIEGDVADYLAAAVARLCPL